MQREYGEKNPLMLQQNVIGAATMRKATTESTLKLKMGLYESNVHTDTYLEKTTI